MLIPQKKDLRIRPIISAKSHVLYRFMIATECQLYVLRVSLHAVDGYEKLNPKDMGSSVPLYIYMCILDDCIVK